MEFDFTSLPTRDRYRLLTNFVGPRPIALVITKNPDGSANAAPMSFFNVVSPDPPLLILGIAYRDEAEKDTLANIRRTGEFAIHMVDDALSEIMLHAARHLPPGEDELARAGAATQPCKTIDSQRLVDAAVTFECRTERILDWPRRAVVLGEVQHMSVRRDCLDAEGRYVDPSAYQPLARLHGDNYIRSDQQFVLPPKPDSTA